MGQKYVLATNDEVVKGNDEALASMKKMGVKFVDLPKADLEEAKKVRRGAVADLTGKVFTQKTIDLFEKTLSSK